MKHLNQSKKNLVTMCDPPEGWRYGFPKPMPDNVEDFEGWLKSEGYPVDEYSDVLDIGCRFWVKEDDNRKTEH